MNQNRHDFRPELESLEHRNLMTAVFLDPSGALNIIGDAGNENVTLYDNGHGSIVGSVNGGGAFSFAGVKDIIIDMGAGNDTVNYRLTDHLQAGTSHTMSVNLRGGDDFFNATFNGSSTPNVFERGSLYLMKVVGEDGNDRMFLDAGNVTMDRATMKIGFYGGEGDDLIGMNYSGLDNYGGVSFFAYGNQGNDTIRMSMWADPASVAPAPGGFRGIIEGNEGDDFIYFDLTAPASVGQAQTSIDGGDGRDIAMTNIDTAHVFNVETGIFF